MKASVEKILCALLAAVMIIALCACARQEGREEARSSDANTSEARSSDTDSSGTAGEGETVVESGTSKKTDAGSEESEISEEEARQAEDSAFLGAFQPAYAPGEAGKAFYHGRWYEKEIEGVTHMVTVTDGAQIFFMVEGAAVLNIEFTVITAKQTPYYAISVDQSEPQRKKITEGTVELPDSGRHLIRIFADGMVESEGKWSSEIGFAVKEIALPEGGRMIQALPKCKTVFFYGDSITEGIAALAPGNTSNENSATAAYPYFCSKELGVTPYYVGYGASGITVDGSFSKLQNAIERLSLKRPITKEILPDLIVINHGTNDWGAASGTFCSALRRALTAMQKTYPGVPIAYVIPFNGTHKSDIEQTAAGFENVEVISTTGWGLTYSDGIHPTKAGAERAGKKLAAALKELYGEEFFAPEEAG